MAGGVEMKGLQMSLLPLESTKGNVVLGEHKFSPYFETNLLSRFADVSGYAESCFEIVRKSALNYLAQNPEYHAHLDQLRRYLAEDKKAAVTQGTSLANNSSSENILESSLLQLFGADTSVGVTEWQEKVPDLLKNDQLLSGLVKSDCLKSILEVILQNGSSTKVNAVQYDMNSQNVGICKSVISFGDLIPYVDINYCLAGPGVQGPVENTDTLLSRVSFINWELNGINTAPSAIREADVLILDNVLSSTSHDPTDFLSKAAQLVQDKGFILIQEPTHNLALPFLMKVLSGRIHDGEGRFCDVASWKNIFQNAGLKLVAEKSDGLLNTLFLCRRIDRDSPMNNIIVSVMADDMDFRWVDDLQRGLRRQAEEGGTVWLYSDNPLNGIYGMMKVFKLEKPKADIR